jgi:hypothetical protein
VRFFSVGEIRPPGAHPPFQDGEEGGREVDPEARATAE